MCCSDYSKLLGQSLWLPNKKQSSSFTGPNCEEIGVLGPNQCCTSVSSTQILVFCVPESWPDENIWGTDIRPLSDG